MRVKKSFRSIVTVVLLMVLLPSGAALGKFQDRSDELPGFSSGATIAIIGGAAAGVLLTVLLLRKRSDKKRAGRKSQTSWNIKKAIHQGRMKAALESAALKPLSYRPKPSRDLSSWAGSSFGLAGSGNGGPPSPTRFAYKGVFRADHLQFPLLPGIPASGSALTPE